MTGLNEQLLELEELGFNLKLSPYPGSSDRTLTRVKLRFSDESSAYFALKDAYPLEQRAIILGWLVDQIGVLSFWRSINWRALDNCEVIIGIVAPVLEGVIDRMQLTPIYDFYDITNCAVSYGNELNATLDALLKAARILNLNAEYKND